MKLNSVKDDQLLLKMSIDEVMTILETLQKKNSLTAEEIKKMRDLDRIVFAYHRNQELSDC